MTSSPLLSFLRHASIPWHATILHSPFSSFFQVLGVFGGFQINPNCRKWYCTHQFDWKQKSITNQKKLIISNWWRQLCNHYFTYRTFYIVNDIGGWNRLEVDFPAIHPICADVSWISTILTNRSVRGTCLRVILLYTLAKSKFQALLECWHMNYKAKKSRLCYKLLKIELWGGTCSIFIVQQSILKEWTL